MKRRAFTLIEILVVLAIVALLSALLLGAFVRVKEKGRQATCQNNLKQIFAAVQIYVQDYDSKFPIAYKWEKAIAPSIKNKQVFRCPSNQDIHPLFDSDYVFNRVRFNTIFIANGKPQLSGLNESQIAETATLMIIYDGAGSSRTVPLPASCKITFRGLPAEGYTATTSHSGGGNYLFADGHVKWLTPESATAIDCAAGPLGPSFS